MANRKAHGAARRRGALTVIETLPFNELPAGVPAFSVDPDSPKAARLREAIAATRSALDALSRGQAGRVAKGEQARLLGQLGGYQRALGQELDRLALEQQEHLAELARELLPTLEVSAPEFKALLPQALEFIQSETASLSRDVAGGSMPNGPSTMIITAALELIGSRVLFARGDFKGGSALGQASGQSLARAHEYAAKRALARRASEPQNPAKRWLRPSTEKSKP